MPSDTRPLFLTLVYAEIERRWNKTPPFAVLPPNSDEQLGGKECQAQCLQDLQWLHAKGDITRLVVRPES